MKAIAVIISIHASLAGGDRSIEAPPRQRLISIHASLAGGDRGVSMAELNVSISIHASLAGGDFTLLSESICRFMISIHASLAGGNPRRCCAAPGAHNFNPRLPRGRRPHTSTGILRSRTFQSTPPSREATQNAMILIDLKQFQSTPPSREATSAVDDELLRAIISIHASLAGGDIL